MARNRRSILAAGAASAVPLVAGTSLVAGAAGQAGGDKQSPGSRGQVPRDLLPGGALDRFAAEQGAAGEFSGSLLVSHRGRTILTRAYGMANQEQKIPNRPNTRFGLASVDKMFSGVAIAQLAQAGKLRYTDRLGDHLDGFPEQVAEQVTIHHMLTHTSGLGDHLSKEFRELARTWTSEKEVSDKTTDYIRERAELAFQPGAGTRYSNSAFYLLGVIAGNNAGMLYYDYARRYIFKPARMTDTDYFTRPDWAEDPQSSRPYELQSGTWIDRIEDNNQVANLLSSGPDLARFMWALQDGETLIAPAYRDLMLSGKVPMGPPQQPPQSSPRDSAGADPRPMPLGFEAYGVIGELINGAWAFGKSGGSPEAAIAKVDAYPHNELVTVFLSNHVVPGIGSVARLASSIIRESGS